MDSQTNSAKRNVFLILVILLFFAAPLTFYGVMSQTKENSKSEFDDSFESGEVFLKKGEYRDAIEKFLEALDFADKLDYGEGRILCNMRLGILYWNIGELGESTKFYKNALSNAEGYGRTHFAEACKKSLDIYRLYSDGKEYRSSGNYKKSIESFEKAIQLAREIGSIAHEVKCLRQLGVSYWATNGFQEFFRLNKNALEKAIKINNRREEFRCLNNIGIYQRKTGNYSEALSLYYEAFRVSEEIGGREEKSIILSNIGNIYKDIGDYDRSLDYLMRSLIIDKEIGIKTNIAIDLINIGEIFRVRGHFLQSEKDYKRALIYFDECLELIEEIRNFDEELSLKDLIEVRVLNNIGTVHLHALDNDTALEVFNKGYEKASDIKDFEALGMILCNTGEAYFSKDEFRRAEMQFIRAIDIAKKTQAPNILWEAYFGLGKCYEQSNEFLKAVENYENSINEIDNIRSRIVIDTFKAGYVRNKLHVYESLLDLLVRLDEKSEYIKERVFRIVEKAKARAFLESIGESQFKIKEKLSLELRQREIEITEKISSIVNRLADPNLSEVHRKAIQKEYLQAENEYMLLISKMRSEIPEVANMIMPEPCDLIQVQNRLLDEKTAVIEYFLGENQSYLFIIEKRTSHMFILPSRSEIRKSIRGLIKELSDPPRREFRGYLASRRLFKELLPHIEDILPESIEHLIVIPDGMLYFLPFEALLSNSNEQLSASSYLIEKYRISYAPSCSSLLFLKDHETKKRHKKALLAIGSPSYDLKEPDLNNGINPSQILKDIYKNQGFDFPPLPYSKKEIKEIEKLFPKPLRDVFMDEKAKEEVVKNTSLEEYQIIHFACHSLLNEKSPFRSALVLALGGDKEDGFLQVREIYNLRLSADMIVLSACQTGRGRLENIEGVFGLPRIFFYCGARSVVSTLWKINDRSTTKFMSYFYKNLSKGKSKSEALRQAKINMIEGRYPHPFYWASFVLYGDGSPLSAMN